jgi:DNA invertase Pin-like site-specific DNA recombinase
VTSSVWKLDRWGRSFADSIKSIQELPSLGVRFVAVTQNIDTDESNPMARFLLHIMAAFAELEREIIRERGGWRQSGHAQRQAVGAAEARVPSRRGRTAARRGDVVAHDRGRIAGAGDHTVVGGCR